MDSFDIVTSLPNTIKHFEDKLKPHQIEGVLRGLKKNGRFLLADPPGMGKSRQALVLADYYLNIFGGICLIVTKCSILEAWKSECDALNLSNCIFNGKLEDLDKIKYIIINYEKLERIVPFKKVKKLKNQTELDNNVNKFDTSLITSLIIDESHSIKNIESNRFKMVEKLATFPKSIICISGTPMLSRPMELFTQLKLIDPTFTSFDKFGEEYCNGGDYFGQSNSTKLCEMLSSKFLIRRCSKVLNLVKRKRTLIWIKLKQNLDKSLQFIDQFNNLPYFKCEIVCLYLKNYVLNSQMEKTIIFGHHKNMLQIIKQLVELENIDYIFIDGSTTKRDILIDKFQTDSKCKIAIMSMTACNTGITLTAAKNIIFTELEMNPADIIQSEGRACRIGQDGEVKITFLITKDSIEQTILNLLLGKENRVDLLNLLEDDERIIFDEEYFFYHFPEQLENLKRQLKFDNFKKPIPKKRRFLPYSFKKFIKQ